jgi:hypothetical protein
VDGRDKPGHDESSLTYQRTAASARRPICDGRLLVDG